MGEPTHGLGLEVSTSVNTVRPSFLPFYSADPLSSLSMEFDSKEEAIAYAAKNGAVHLTN